MKVLVVGAGFAGSVIARELAEAGGVDVTVIDRRDHLAGNAYDPVHPKTGSRYHMYGPHIFHTNSKKIVDYLSRFTQWLPYRHRVQALFPGEVPAPMPINRTTLNSYYGAELSSESDMRAFLDRSKESIREPKNAEQHLLSIYGRELTELCFGRYTRKMWGLGMDEMPITLVARLPIRYDDNPYYFNDEYQLMPAQGYASLIGKMLDHPKIELSLHAEFDKAMEREYAHVFNSMPIDEYFDSCFGPLPYRSIQFEHRFAEAYEYDVPTLNFTDEGPYTRKTCWALYPGCEGERGAHVTYEIPCSYEDNQMERYYPIKTVDGWPQRRYKEYEALASQRDRMTFIGRCGQYVYYDMHQAVANSLMLAKSFIANRVKGTR